MYRTKNEKNFDMTCTSHRGRLNGLKYQARGQNMPVAIVLGGPTLDKLAALAGVPPETADYEVLGAFYGHPAKLVRCETNDSSHIFEHHLGELFPRVGFIVTTVTGTNRAVVRFYNQRGTAEQWIKEGKAATHWTRLACHRFRANEVRLLLGVIAYNLGNLLRRLVLPVAIQSWSLTRLQQRLFKTGGRLIRHARYFVLQLAESYLTPTLFRQILGRIERLAWHQT